MGRSSGLFTIGIFIIFLAILFHYFCRSRKKPELIVQQQVVPEGYVYPVTPSNLGHSHSQQPQVIIGPNHSQLYPSVPLPYPVMPGGQYNYAAQNHNDVHLPPYSASANHSRAAQAHSNQPEDQPPPYHVAVGLGPPMTTSTHHLQ